MSDFNATGFTFEEATLASMGFDASKANATNESMKNIRSESMEKSNEDKRKDKKDN